VVLGFLWKGITVNARVWMPEGKGPISLVLGGSSDNIHAGLFRSGYEINLGEFLSLRKILASVE